MLGTSRLRQFFHNKFSLKRWFSSKLTFRTWSIIVISLGAIGIIWLNWGRIHQLYQQASGADPVAFWKFDEGQGELTKDSINSTQGYLATSSNNFATRVDYASGTGPISVVFIDFNNDGKDDLATAHSSSNYISVFLNNGDGTFAARANYSTVTASMSLASGDFNKDGYNDIVAVNSSSPYGISIFINDGDGTFATKVDYASESQPYSVAVADVNGDSYPDLGVANFTSPNNISVYLNNGDGTFAARINYPVGAADYPLEIALGDLNNDNYADIVTTDQNDQQRIAVRMNDGDGTFASTVYYTAGGGQPSSVALGDVNNDGFNDILFGRASNLAAIYLNNGDGTFTTLLTATVGTAPDGITGADLNRDGYLDIITANRSSNTISVLMNNGNNTFATKVDSAAPTNATTPATGDANGDNVLDIAVVGYGSQITSVFINNGSPPSWQTENKCISEKCISFDGSDDYISVHDGDTSDMTIGSFSMWVKPSTLTTGQAPGFFGIQESSSPWDNGDGSLLLRFRESSGWKTELVYPNAGTATSLYGTTTISSNTWYHIAATYNGSTYSLYLNGKLENSVSKSGNNLDTNQGPRIANAYSGNYFSGFIDEVKVYDYALSSTQIKSDYAGGSSAGSSAVLGQEDQSFLSNGLVGYWKMENIIATDTVEDSSGNNNIAESLHGVGSVNGKFGEGGNFDGIESYLELDNSTLLSPGTEDFTVAAWVNIGSTGSTQTIYSDPGTGDNTIALYYGVSGFSFNIQDTNDISIVSTGTTIAQENRWYHVVGVRDDTNVYIYVNGILETKAIEPELTDIITSGGEAPEIGAYSATPDFVLDGVIDEVRVYKHALNSSQVLALYEWKQGPVAYWNLDDGSGSTASDKSGNEYNATLESGSSAPTWSIGKIGGALFFDGSGDSAYVTDPSDGGLDFGSQNFTVSYWVKTTYSGSAKNIVEKRVNTDAVNPGYAIGNNSTGTIFASIQDGTDKVTANSTGIVNDGKWHYVTVAFVRSGSTHIYIDGVLDNNASSITAVDSVDNANNLYLGRSWSGANGTSFPGTVDDIRIYNYILTQEQITRDMNGEHPSPGSPVGSAVGHYRLDEGYGTTINNAGNGGIGLTGTFGSGNSAPTWTNDGKFGKAISFDGSSDYIDMGTAPALGPTGDLTLAVWIKHDGTAINRAIYSAGSTDNNYWYITLTSSHDLGFTEDGTLGVTAGTTISSNEWHHIIVIKSGDSGNNIKFYVDGLFISEAATDTVIASGIKSIGGRLESGGLNFFKGQIDEVKLYHLALTSDQVKVEYNQGKAIVLGAGSTGVGGTSPSNSNAREYCPPGDTSTCTAPVGEWKLDEGQGTTGYDTSNNTSNSVFATGNSEPLWAKGLFGNALAFDGSGDATIATNNSDINFSGDYSTSVWIKTRSMPNFSSIYTKVSSGTTNGYALQANSTSSTLQVAHANSGPWNTTISLSSVTDNRWHNIQIVRSGTTMYAYLDGQVINSGTYATNPTTGTSSLYFGVDRQRGNGFSGLIDQVRFYGYARTAVQVAWEYNQGKPVVWYRLDDCTGSTVYNGAKYANGQPAGNNGTITIGASGSQTSTGTCSSGTSTQAWNNGTTGKFNGSLNFDGTDDYVVIPNNSSITLSNPFSIGVWIKTTNPNGEVLSKHNENVTNGLRFFISSGIITFDPTSSSGHQTLSSTKTVNDGNWHYIVGILNGTDQRLYIDGILNNSRTYVGTVNINSLDLTFASVFGDSVRTNYYSGQIDEVKIFNYPLTIDQIRTNMAAGAVRFQ